MKWTLIAVLMGLAAAAPMGRSPAGLRAKSLALPVVSRSSGANFGNPKCPCIGFNNIEGTTTVPVDGEEVTYPGDLGARCEAWDDGYEPKHCMEGQSPGTGNGWCAQKWCYVDSCNCDLPVLPKPSVYVPEATYQGKPVFFSYQTCGGTDTYTQEVAVVGSHSCRCTGFRDSPGTIDVQIGGGKTLEYPAEIGSTCTAWDDTRHPDCTGDGEKPSWCGQKWCFVDPCSCNLEVPPKTSSYLPDSTFQGRKIYYSYATCGGKDSWTAENHKAACVNQKSEDGCGKLEKCAWTGTKCLGEELVSECGLKKPRKMTEARTKSGAGTFRPVALAAVLLIVMS